MGELTSYIKNKLFNKEVSYSDEQMARVSIKSAIDTLCDEYLDEIGDVFTFEVDPKEIENVIMVLNEEPLASKYMINQISETQFTASYRALHIDFE